MASKGINKVILVGNLGADPETRYMPSGSAVTNITIATSESYKDKQTQEKVEKTEWHRVVFFNRLAEIAGEYLKKGSKVYIEGRLQTRKWDKNGVDMYTTEIVASEMQMLDSKGIQQESSSMVNDINKANAMQYAKASGGTQQAGPALVSTDFDDDIPF